ncbi:MAG: repair protein RecO [Gemmatimonadota bacterium]|jgi:DNA repair protein RecO (recombination protein O)
MPLLSTDAIILHTADYLESSRLVRMLTREAGVVSAVARGMRASRRRFGSAMDLFAEGQAQLQVKSGRDLHALQGFDVSVSRAALAADLDRFAAANALAEVVLRLVHEEAAPVVFDQVRQAFDHLGKASTREQMAGVALAAIWQVVGEVGYRPVLDECAECHGDIAVEEEASFMVAMGGLVCLRCAAHRGAQGRRLPVSARNTLRRWITAGEAAPSPSAGGEVDGPLLRAHQRLLREFLSQYLPDSRPLRAFHYWESIV